MARFCIIAPHHYKNVNNWCSLDSNQSTNQTLKMNLSDPSKLYLFTNLCDDGSPIWVSCKHTHTRMNTHN